MRCYIKDSCCSKACFCCGVTLLSSGSLSIAIAALSIYDPGMFGVFCEPARGALCSKISVAGFGLLSSVTGGCLIRQHTSCGRGNEADSLLPLQVLSIT